MLRVVQVTDNNGLRLHEGDLTGVVVMRDGSCFGANHPVIYLHSAHPTASGICEH